VGQTAVTYGFDDANRLTSVTQGANAVGFTYDAASRRTTATLPNSVSIDYGYDNANQLTSITHKRLGATLQALSYTYDLAGRRITMGGSAARINLPPALASATYDANNRLTNWGGATLTYDFNGNLTNDGTQTYTWDTRDRLTALSGSIGASFGYDAFNRRYSKTIGGTQSGTLYDGWREVHTTTGATINSTYLNGLGLDERYARTQSGTTLTFLPDAVGSTVNLVSPGGAMTGTFTYEPYGSSTQSGADNTQFRYTGREEDGTGLMYYRNRYYSPRLSRFVSEDPIGLAGGDNLYAYVGGDPLGLRDPLGEHAIVAPILILAGGWSAYKGLSALADFISESKTQELVVQSREIDRKQVEKDPLAPIYPGGRPRAIDQLERERQQLPIRIPDAIEQGKRLDDIISPDEKKLMELARKKRCLPNQCCRW
jgi:RHS repeat-associated protein